MGAASSAAEREVAEGAFGFRFMAILVLGKGVRGVPG